MGSSGACYSISCSTMVRFVLLLCSTWMTHIWSLPTIDPILSDYEEGSAKFGAPIIIPSESDVTLEVGSEYNLTCRSTKPVTWRMPGLYVEHTISTFERSGSRFPQGSILTLHNVQVENVGKYYCIETEFNSTQYSELEILITLFRAESIYVYVNDPNRLLAPADLVVMAVQYADAIIPCKPSSKHVQVQLLREDESALDIPYRYDPTVGFIAKMIHLYDGGTYICRPKSDFIQINYIDVRVHGSYTDFINRPTIKSETNGHAIKGTTLTLECSVDIRPSVQFSINWTLPNNNAAVKEGRVTVTNTTKQPNPDTTELEIGRNNLIVHNVNEMDAGYYTCGVIDHSGNYNNETLFVRILRNDESYINMSEPSNHYTIEASVKKRRTRMLVKYKAYPPPSLIWYNNHNEPINANESGEKYIVERTSDSILLEIRNIDLSDTGTYTLKADNKEVQKELKFQVFIKDKPTVKMEETIYVQVGGEANLICECAGYPKPQITWMYTPCQIKPKWPSCFPASLTKFESNSYRTVEKSILLQHSELKFRPNQPGFVKCLASNSEGNDTFEAAVLLGDLSEPFAIYGIPDNHVIAAGDDVALTCSVLAYNYSANMDWYRNESLIESNSDDYQIEFSESEYSYKNKLIMKNIDYDKSGMYECRANLIDDHATPESRIIEIKIHEPKAPHVTHSNLNGAAVGKKLGEVLNLECQYEGLPEPMISWFKDDVRIEPDKNNTRLFLEQRNTKLSIPFIKPEDEGTYKCVVSNRLGSVEKTASVKISNLPSLPLAGILSIIGLFIVLVILIIYLCIRFCREKKLRKELKAAGLANFEEGAVECINNALSLDEQADLLPYDRRFEFPKEKLKLGKQLGAGAFGVVLKAIAEGIIPDEKDTTVAVKMVKKTADNEVMKALVSELKIMVHLGQHLNVVNLLGAVTKNIAKREVMVIVEYCRYGNVQTFLLKNRKNFINQINPKTDQIDPSIVTKEMRFSGDYEYNSRQSGDIGSNYMRDAGFDYVSANVNSAATDMTTIPGEESIILSNNSIQPAWRSNYKPDDLTAMDINTTQLVSWAFQVARGMDYLASRKVLHGDLAARNILLCDDNVVKICDFGLARSMYKSDNYKKHGEAPLPIKWLALESMSDQVFSTYSDIWSFGIVLWEFFSLAKVPYPGMDADENLYLKLKDGYRMEKPEYANQELYDIMLECWSTNPEMRPAFNVLEKRFARMLGDDITNHYVDLNDPYLRVNSDYFTNGKTDYLALMGCPDEMAPQAPRYVNGKMIAELAANNSGDNQYVQMQPKSGNAIFSPRAEDDEIRADHFTFPPPISPTISNNLDSPSSKSRKKGVIPEEVPMLNRSAGSDSETELSPDAISSPSKQFSSLNKMSDAKTRVSDDNYVNVPGSDTNKSRTKDAFSNPEYLMLNTVNEKRK